MADLRQALLALPASLAVAVTGAAVSSCGAAPQANAGEGPRREAAAGEDDPASGGDRARPSEATDGQSEAPPLRVLEGRASYYADSLAGRPTASGEPYDPTALTAASRDLPFGTVVRVVRVDDDGQDMASVVVRVNDRGPHRDHTRILDLSRAAAEALDMIRAGVVRIRAEILSLP